MGGEVSVKIQENVFFVVPYGYSSAFNTKGWGWNGVTRGFLSSRRVKSSSSWSCTSASTRRPW